MQYSIASHKNVNIVTIPSTYNNYVWGITQNSNNLLALVDPGNAKVCLDYIESENKQLSSILITHHHHDHLDGLDELIAYCKNRQWPLKIFSPEYQELPNQSQLPIPIKRNKRADVIVRDGMQITLKEFDLSLKVIDVSGHTLEHIAYLNDEFIFSGDSLFSGGCGRRFEGGVKQMHDSLIKLANLPDKLFVYCAHEYTESNLAFALHVEPDNQDLQAYYHTVIEKRKQNIPTIPTNLGLEKKINPFLRTDQLAVNQSVSKFANKPLTNASDVFNYLRQWKDQA